MKIADLRKKSAKDLQKQEATLREKIAAIRIEQITKDEKNYKQNRNLRRDLARVLTVLNEEEPEVEAKADNDDANKETK